MTTHSISKKDISISNFKAKLLQFVNPSFCSILPSLIMAYFSSVSKIALNISDSAHTIALLRIGANLCGLGAGRGWACRAGEGVRRGGAEVAEPLTLRSRPRRCAGARRHWASRGSARPQPAEAVWPCGDHLSMHRGAAASREGSQVEGYGRPDAGDGRRKVVRTAEQLGSGDTRAVHKAEVSGVG